MLNYFFGTSFSKQLLLSFAANFRNRHKTPNWGGADYSIIWFAIPKGSFRRRQLAANFFWMQLAA